MSMEVSYGIKFSTAYIQLNDEKIHHSQQIDDLTIVDIDKFGCVVGIELLDIREIPSIETLRKLVHVKECDLRSLKMFIDVLRRTTLTSSSPTERSRVKASEQAGQELESI